MTFSLPKSSCPLGYTISDLEKILGSDLPRFNRWMIGQTVSLCDGKTYDHGVRRYRTSKCSGQRPGVFIAYGASTKTSHGMVVYPWDLDRYLKGLPVID